MTSPDLSIVLATRDRASLLERFLLGLCSQVNPPSFEVIIADNGSSDRTPYVIAHAADQLPVRGIRVDIRGKSRALNAALRLTKGPLIVFTDDDVQPDQKWLASFHAAAMRHPECKIFGGQIEVNIEAVPQWVLRSYNLMGLLTSAHHQGDVDTIYGFGQYPFGPNMAIRRYLLADIDSPYPEHLGPGSDLPVGDESIFLQKFSPPGARDRIYIPSAQVVHEVERENVAFSSALRRCFVAGRGHGQHVLPAISGVSDRRSPTFHLILARMASCRSFQEIACIITRYLGYLRGVVEGKARRNTTESDATNV